MRTIPILGIWACREEGSPVTRLCAAASRGIRFLAIDLPELLPRRLVKSKVVSSLFLLLKIRANVAFFVGPYLRKINC